MSKRLAIYCDKCREIMKKRFTFTIKVNSDYIGTFHLCGRCYREYVFDVIPEFLKTEVCEKGDETR
jgi:hypothetical protein